MYSVSPRYVRSPADMISGGRADGPPARRTRSRPTSTAEPRAPTASPRDGTALGGRRNVHERRADEGD